LAVVEPPACLLYLRSEAVAAGSQGLHTSLVPRQYPVPGSRVVTVVGVDVRRWGLSVVEACVLVAVEVTVVLVVVGEDEDVMDWVDVVAVEVWDVMVVEDGWVVGLTVVEEGKMVGDVGFEVVVAFSVVDGAAVEVAASVVALSVVAASVVACAVVAA